LQSGHFWQGPSLRTLEFVERAGGALQAASVQANLSETPALTRPWPTISSACDATWKRVALAMMRDLGGEEFQSL
jgi:hypothetical protein